MRFEVELAALPIQWWTAETRFASLQDPFRTAIRQPGLGGPRRTAGNAPCCVYLRGRAARFVLSSAPGGRVAGALANRLQG